MAFAIYFERKFAGFFAGRVGPTYVGPWGSFQSFGDIFKLLSKEDVTPLRADKPVFKLAPYIAFIPAFLVMAVLPFGPVGGEPNLFGYRFDYVIANFDAGLVLFLAMGAMAVYGVVLAGWSSNSNYSLLGGLRAGAQMISYELAMGFSVVGVMLMAGSMNFVDIVNGQAGNFWDWYFIPQIVGRPHLLHRQHRRAQPHAVRPGRGRAGAGGRATSPSTRACAGACSTSPNT